METAKTAEIVRSELIELLGGFPEKEALDATIAPAYETGAYKAFRVRFRCEGDQWASAYLLEPRESPLRHDDGSLPAVLCLHQHASQYNLGKSETVGLLGNPDFAYGKMLAELGFLVLAPDMDGFEDRQGRVWRGNHWETGERYDRFASMREIVAGKTLARRYIWDVMRCVDFLMTLNQLDRNRIGCIGHSLGGTLSVWAAALDERISASVSNCGVSTYRSIIDGQVNHNFMWVIPGIMKKFDMGDVGALVAPRPFMVLAGEKDGYFPIRGVMEFAEGVAAAYKRLGALERFRFKAYPDTPHSFSADMRREAIDWLTRYLA